MASNMDLLMGHWCMGDVLRFVRRRDADQKRYLPTK